VDGVWSGVGGWVDVGLRAHGGDGVVGRGCWDKVVACRSGCWIGVEDGLGNSSNGVSVSVVNDRELSWRSGVDVMVVIGWRNCLGHVGVEIVGWRWRRVGAVAFVVVGSVGSDLLGGVSCWRGWIEHAVDGKLESWFRF